METDKHRRRHTRPGADHQRSLQNSKRQKSTTPNGTTSREGSQAADNGRPPIESSCVVATDGQRHEMQECNEQALRIDVYAPEETVQESEQGKHHLPGSVDPI